MIDLAILFAGVGLIIILGFLGNYFFRKTKIPDVIWLILLGLILGPILNVIGPSLLVQYITYFAALALMIILFESGLNTKLCVLIKESPRSLVLAVSCILLSMFVVTWIMQYLFNWPLLYGLLLGAIIGGSSSAIVNSVTNELNIDERVKTILNLESTMSDVLCIVLSIALIQAIVLGDTSITLTLNKIFGSFSIGAMVGLITGIVWLMILKKIKGKPFEYMLTLAILFILYAFIEKIMGSAAIGALAFGIVLGNAKDISRILRTREKLVIDRMIRKFHLEITFLIRTFFFVYLGLIVSVTNYLFMLVGVIITIALFFIRILAVEISTLVSNFTSFDKKFMSVIMPRGLAATVLLQFIFSSNLSYVDMFTDLIFVVIVSSIAICSTGLLTIKK